MITLHLYHLSPFNEKIQRMLNVKGVPYQSRYWRIAERRGILAISPTGKLPALEHNGTVICDSTDMAHYIEAQFPEPALIPTDPVQRGLTHALEDWADESLYFYEMTLRFTLDDNANRNVPRLLELESGALRWLLTRLLPGTLRKLTRSQGVGRKSRDALLRETERHIQAVADMLDASDWLVGNRLTLADLAVYAMFQCFRDATAAAAILEKYPRVTAWMTRIEEQTSTEPA
ncbi:MAG: glutathione S-transferase family protein [Halieaceae bacterium]|nr:glutathione S-transferase family protein [Halieaceae bacterium]